MSKANAGLPVRSNRGRAGKRPVPRKPAKALHKVLAQTEEVKGLVEEAAVDLSVVNTGLKQAIKRQNTPPHVEKALQTSETAEVKVQEAAEKLSVVNNALKQAVQERKALEVQLEKITEHQDELRHASFHDSLTGLPNRALANNRLEHGLAQAKRHGWHLAVMFIDLDDFKKINDTYGHDAGDRVLTIIAQRLGDATREDDTLSRHGGDEFLYVLTEYESEHDLAAIAEKLIMLIQTPCQISTGTTATETTETKVSASIGIAIFPKHGSTSEALVKSADSAMYRAKRSRFRYSFAR